MSDVEEPSHLCQVTTKGSTNSISGEAMSRKSYVLHLVFECTIVGVVALASFSTYDNTASASEIHARNLATYAMLTLTSVSAADAVLMYQEVCPGFTTDGTWSGSCGVGGAEFVTLSKPCAKSNQFQDIVPVSLAIKKGPKWRYHYDGAVEITCREGRSTCSVTGVVCDASTPPPNPPATTQPTSSPVTTPSPSPPTSSILVVQWTANNEATIEFCDEGGSYGYRIPGSGAACGPAGVVVRMTPGQDYILTLQNNAAPSVVTNIHTHGLHISGSGNSDDPTRHVAGGCELKYHWNIPADHMGGTYWMHAHHHESTQIQVANGAFAMLIIEENPSTTSSLDASSKQNIEDWMQKELILQASKVGSTRLGNGKSDETFDLFANEWYRLRVSAVDPAGKRGDISIPSGCEARPAAYDGVWSFNVPGDRASTYSLTGASRMDLAIKCASVGSYNVEFSKRSVATLNVVSGASSTPDASPFTSTGATWATNRPSYLRDLASGPSSAFQSYEIGMSASQINGVSYDPNVSLDTFSYDTLQEWTISGSGAHPYHLHVYHMQVVSGCGDHVVGEYYDTISASGSCTVRFPMIGIAERIIMHCHVLSHEDNGAMTWVYVDPEGDASLIQSTVDRNEICEG